MIGMTIDEALRPTTMKCCKCGGILEVYPCPIPEGTGYCAICSPHWLKDFAEWLTDQERIKRGLAPLKP